jgi:hypothetical protein
MTLSGLSALINTNMCTRERADPPAQTSQFPGTLVLRPTSVTLPTGVRRAREPRRERVPNVWGPFAAPRTPF